MINPAIGFHIEEGTLVVMTAAGSGEDHCGTERAYQPGDIGRIEMIDTDDGAFRVHVGVACGIASDGTDAFVVNVFEEDDEAPRFPFKRADPITVRMLDLIRVVSQTSSPSGGWSFEGLQDAMASFIEDAKAIVAELAPMEVPEDAEAAAMANGWHPAPNEPPGVLRRATSKQEQRNNLDQPWIFAHSWAEACRIDAGQG